MAALKQSNGRKAMLIKLCMQGLAFYLLLALAAMAHSDGPPVKKSVNDICHPVGGQYYSRTKNYTPYPTMQACINSGGRAAKR